MTTDNTVSDDDVAAAFPSDDPGAGQSDDPAAGHPYFANSAGMFRRRGGEEDGVVQLTNFSAQIVASIIRDDGTETETALQIEAELRGRTHSFTIPASVFPGMNWPVAQIGPDAIVCAGVSAKDHGRAAIQCLSRFPIARRVVFTHTGWRQINGLWVYLHAAGGIGPDGIVEGIDVELPGALSEYRLPAPPRGDALRDAVKGVLALLDLAPDRIVAPLFCAPWRAVLGPCDFALHLAGPTGVFKSELAALVQQHFGAALDARHLPGSWHSTDNALEGLLFAAKDALIVVDDFAPSGGPHDIARWHSRADRVLRAQGNNAGRARMRADGSLRPPKPPRGQTISTGEEVPRGQSLRARTHIDEVGPGDIDLKALSLCQRLAREGIFAGAMAGFLRWLAPKYGEIKASMRSEIERLRGLACRGDGHRRTPEIVASLALGLHYFTQFAEEAGAISHGQAQELWDKGWAALGEAAARQQQHQASQEPARRFIELLQAAVVSGHAHLAGNDGGPPVNAPAWGWRRNEATSALMPQGDRVGWVDYGDVVLEPDASYRAACAMSSNGDGLAISAVTLRKRLAERGWIIREPSRETLLVRRKIEGRTLNVLALTRGVYSQKPDIPDIPTIDPTGGPENADSMSGSMSGSLPRPDIKPDIFSPQTPDGGPENADDVRNGGNVRFCQGEGSI
jgi:hypothetical protein